MHLEVAEGRPTRARKVTRRQRLPLEGPSEGEHCTVSIGVIQFGDQGKPEEGEGGATWRPMGYLAKAASVAARAGPAVTNNYFEPKPFVP